ncbi:glycosyltransferase [Asanoa sp. WMMD1127]|uniref:glycosyltransferase n=1 Tax=Asanoa sp. WMMD1127 TaxID=3016107 RepID=UPI0024171318|nr:glycosyltransferase [Asanoa sp. WMMD1127]MDG4825206.1 glycosyltransferase [Asanoa sp. WMMD1127]
MTTVVDCSGVGPGGITRVLTAVVRHWPNGRQLTLVAVPAGWEPPAGTTAAVSVRSRQNGGRERTIAAATAALRRETAGAGRVLSLSPSLAIVGSRAPVTTIVHDLAFRLWPRGLGAAQLHYRRVSYGTAIARSARLLCVSARTLHDLSGLYDETAARADVWHPGSDYECAPGPSPVSGRYLLVAGHAPHKGVELAIEALPDLPGYTLAVLTGGTPVASFADAARRSAAADRVLFLDRLDDAAYVATVAGAAAFLMPSHFEGYGLPAAEALALGTPTVISPDPALLEATGGAAVRMTTWSAPALAAATTAALTGPRPAPRPGRSWRDATAELVALLDGEPAEAGR